jgi:hypothetical protein
MARTKRHAARTAPAKGCRIRTIENREWAAARRTGWEV